MQLVNKKLAIRTRQIMSYQQEFETRSLYTENGSDQFT